eukprot:3749829-Rhodomonas_salina.3
MNSLLRSNGRVKPEIYSLVQVVLSGSVSGTSCSVDEEPLANRLWSVVCMEPIACCRKNKNVRFRKIGKEATSGPQHHNFQSTVLVLELTSCGGLNASRCNGSRHSYGGDSRSNADGGLDLEFAGHVREDFGQRKVWVKLMGALLRFWKAIKPWEY